MNPFKTKPMLMAVGIMTLMYGADVALIGTNVLHGGAAAIATAIATVLNAVLGVAAHNQSTSLADPRNRAGEKLVPEHLT